jgi:hypothetical protein
MNALARTNCVPQKQVSKRCVLGARGCERQQQLYLCKGPPAPYRLAITPG